MPPLADNIEVGDCWVWQGAANDMGYGVVNYKGKRWYTHRLVYTMLVGYTPPVLDHLCMNTLCCNPEHLEDVSQRTNSARAAKLRRKALCHKGHRMVQYGGKRRCRGCYVADDK